LRLDQDAKKALLDYHWPGNIRELEHLLSRAALKSATPENRLALVIPEGCAHGFQVLEENSELLYSHTAFYKPDAEGALRYDDSRINVSWPLTPTDLSIRDLNHPFIKEDFTGIVL
jgi:dTDP-4-dehydrorhamnose 3,5-epimerase-like enzyme